jgi:hypothetical protein
LRRWYERVALACKPKKPKQNCRKNQNKSAEKTKTKLPKIRKQNTPPVPGGVFVSIKRNQFDQYR